MKCPYCSKEMELGVIQSPNEIAWQKDKHLFGRFDLTGQYVYRSILF